MNQTLQLLNALRGNPYDALPAKLTLEKTASMFKYTLITIFNEVVVNNIDS